MCVCVCVNPLSLDTFAWQNQWRRREVIKGGERERRGRGRLSYGAVMDEFNRSH